MPKATLIRKPNTNKNEHTGNSDDTKSVDLLGFSWNHPVDGDSVCSSWNKQAQGQQKIHEEREGARRVQENVRGDTENSQEDRVEYAVERVGFEENPQHYPEQDNSSDGKEHCCSGVAETSKCGERKIRKRKKVDDGTWTAVKKGKRNSKTEGRGAEKEGKEQEGSDEERKRAQDFERKEFEESTGIAPPMKILHGPYSTDEMFCVDIVLDDGYLYRVSECSVKDKMYTQGLDSRFLISRFHPYIKKATC